MGPDGGNRTVYIGLNALDMFVAREFVQEGAMPVLARLLDEAAAQETIGPLGFFVSAIWPSIYTGMTPTRHGYLCGGEVKGGTYDPVWQKPLLDPPGIWDYVSRAGGRVAVVDAPHTRAHEINGVMVTEWNCHDRHSGTFTYPASLLAELDDKYGPSESGKYSSRGLTHYAPCDLGHRAGVRRTLEENKAFLDSLLVGHEQKRALVVDLLEQGGWDLVFASIDEAHCVGHQFWNLHDPSHPWHDPEHLAALGGDPMRTIYSTIDRSVGDILAAAGDDAMVYVHLSHGMQPHFDGLCLLEPLLWQLDEYASGRGDGGRFTRAADSLVGALPRSARARAISAAIDVRRRMQARTGPIAHSGSMVIPEWVGQRRWWAAPNDSVYGAVRLNLEAREPHGRVAAAHKRDVELWLADRLFEVINADTGEPAIRNVYLTDEHFERRPGDAMADVIIDWNRNAPIDTVWSPATGVVSVPYNDWRTGDHHEHGLLLAIGPGVVPGRRSGRISVIDVAPTLAASLDLDVPEFDGVARPDLLPARARNAHELAAVLPRAPANVPVRTTGRRRWARRFDVPGQRWIEDYAIGLSRSLHAEHVRAVDLGDEVARLHGQIGALERLAQISEVTAWLRHIDVPETLRISVVIPTHNRAAVLERAVESVQRQTYGNWELVIVDDASTDDTWPRLEKLAANEPRIRVFRLETAGHAAGARNHGLENAEGDVVVYLDDDNRFDPDWLRAVAWAFTEYPDTAVCYGARVIDDDLRHQNLSGRSLPIIQFNAWDRDTMLDRNLVDVNVIAHRASDARFDPALTYFADWDLLLKLTDDGDPMALPVVAVHYYSDVLPRLSDDLVDERVVAAETEYLQQRARTRRQAQA